MSTEVTTQRAHDSVEERKLEQFVTTTDRSKRARYSGGGMTGTFVRTASKRGGGVSFLRRGRCVDCIRSCHGTPGYHTVVPGAGLCQASLALVSDP